MTEQQWLSSTDPQVMLEWLRDQGKLSERKARLFAAACCRHVWSLLTDERSQRAVEVAEQYADGLVDARERRLAEDEGKRAAAASRGVVWFAALAAKMTAAHHIPVRQVMSYTPVDHKVPAGDVELRRSEQAQLLRDLFGPLAFRSVTLPASIRTANDSLVRRLAEQAYQQRQLPSGQLDNARLAVLADALEEAGYQEPDILSHLRQQGAVHIRGCFALDLCLGAE